MADDKKPVSPTPVAGNATSKTSELSDGELDKVTGGTDPLHRLAQVTHIKAANLKPVIDDDDPRLP